MRNKIAKMLRSVAGKFMNTGHRLSWYAGKLDSKARDKKHAKK